MILPSVLASVLALGAQFILPVSDSVPVLNVEPVCQGIAVQGGSSFHDPAIAKEKQDCLQSEKETRDELVKRWSTFSAADKNHCINEASMGGDSSYTELLTCLEMARDVRNLGSEQDAPATAMPKRKR
jgi:hypothetical protein